MPYTGIENLPKTLHHLPRHAQEIFLAAFNNAWRSYADRGPEAQEQIAHKVAWAAVKRRYRKWGNEWVERTPMDKRRSAS